MPKQEVAVTQHEWVKIEFCPVQVLVDDDGQPVVLVDPEQQILATEESQYGCGVCSEPLQGNLGTECQGSDADIPPL